MGDDSRPVAAAAGGEHHPGAAPSDPDVLASIAAEAGIRRIHFVAWRDLDDPATVALVARRSQPSTLPSRARWLPA